MLFMWIRRVIGLQRLLASVAFIVLGYLQISWLSAADDTEMIAVTDLLFFLGFGFWFVVMCKSGYKLVRTGLPYRTGSFLLILIWLVILVFDRRVSLQIQDWIPYALEPTHLVRWFVSRLPLELAIIEILLPARFRQQMSSP